MLLENIAIIIFLKAVSAFCRLQQCDNEFYLFREYKEQYAELSRTLKFRAYNEKRARYVSWIRRDVQFSACRALDDVAS